MTIGHSPALASLIAANGTTPDMTPLVFKIVDRASWDALPADAPFAGSAVDVRDGFIHFSSATQVAGTAARHFAGRRDLLLVAADAAALGAALRWEPSRHGEPFPHLYGPLPRAAVRWVADLPLGNDGVHVLPRLDP
jgi:uncharacterized protein (DUF952 family)